jgi:hypothetical protein
MALRTEEVPALIEIICRPNQCFRGRRFDELKQKYCERREMSKFRPLHSA